MGGDYEENQGQSVQCKAGIWSQKNWVLFTLTRWRGSVFLLVKWAQYFPVSIEELLELNDRMCTKAL